MFEKLQSSSSLSWEESEAPLYIMSCVASYLPIDEDKIVPNVIQAIISTPTQSGLIHTALKYTGVRLIAQLDEWIAKNNEQILSNKKFFISNKIKIFCYFRINYSISSFITC
jgi:hypothetical protein